VAPAALARGLGRGPGPLARLGGVRKPSRPSSETPIG
jgi:hypothetical protein